MFFVDADTVVSPQVVAAALRHLDRGAAGGGAPARFEGPVPLYAHLLMWWLGWLMRIAGMTGGAFMFMTRDAFRATGGFDETLAVAYNDVDLCLRLGAKSFRNVWTPFAELYHFESISRGDDLQGENRPRFLAESQAMRDRWQELLTADPYYNPNLSLTRADLWLAYPPRHRRPWWDS